MKLIAHRGNFNGICSRFENLPEYIDEALEAGYDAEIDVWCVNGELFLGHDEPQYKIKEKWLLERESKLWCHAKNINAVLPLVDAGLHCFFHGTDEVTLTSKNFLWTYPGKTLTSRSIAVMPDMLGLIEGRHWIFNKDFFGICSDDFKSYVNI